ncbi:hypothetical protein SZ64_10960 [Erythrobacter sp. SG61-1L]|uniref:hypothetical protein n=1 Tax=Erythrobacter sp. SG61-1L TaxID=1603897 RepID=UPI0006C8FDB7|nr:hypothetical protein [Erythrobacter sp. SG61-1L]KPL68578.1 hypothetical protein SZ64_10960 [Erythrobacter sp. SG61-1L]
MSVAMDMKRGAWRWICTLLVLVAAMHAVLPSGQPLQRVSGSAFSASTSDVAVGFGTRAEERRQAQPQPAPLPVARLAVFRPLALQLPGRPFAPRPETRGPPLFETTLSPLSPRAPPFA